MRPRPRPCQPRGSGDRHRHDAVGRGGANQRTNDPGSEAVVVERTGDADISVTTFWRSTGRHKASWAMTAGLIPIAALLLGACSGTSAPLSSPTTNPSPTNPSPTPSTETPPSTSPSLESLSSLVPAAASNCGVGIPIASGILDVETVNDSTSCNWDDSDGNPWTLAAWQFPNSADATEYFNWLVGHNTNVTPAACSGGSVSDCEQTWSNSSNPSTSGQVWVQSGSTTWWVIPSQNALFEVNNNLGNYGSTEGTAWFYQNVVQS